MNDFEVLQVGGKYPPLAGAKECVAITMGETESRLSIISIAQPKKKLLGCRQTSRLRFDTLF